MSCDALLEDTGNSHCVVYCIIVTGELVFFSVLSPNRYNLFQDFSIERIFVFYQKLIPCDNIPNTDGIV